MSDFVSQQLPHPLPLLQHLPKLLEIINVSIKDCPLTLEFECFFLFVHSQIRQIHTFKSLAFTVDFLLDMGQLLPVKLV